MPKIFARSPDADYSPPDAKAIRKLVGKRIRAARNRHKMTQIELAKNLGFKSQAYVAGIESGAKNLPAAEFIRLAMHLRFDLSYFYP